MASEIFLDMKDFPGESQADGFENQIDILSFSLGASNASSVATGAGSGVAGPVPTDGAELVATCNLPSAAGSRRATCSFVSGPQRYDIAQRVVKRRGVEDFAETSRNCRFPSAPIDVSSAATSVPPAAERRPSSTRALSFSVWSLPTSHVPAFDIAL